MIYIYAPQPSDGARALVNALGARRIRRIRVRPPPSEGSLIVCWGRQLPVRGYRTLNDVASITKLEELQCLFAAGLLVPPFVVVVPQGCSHSCEHHAPVLMPPTEWLSRSNNHIGGHDLLSPPLHPSYYVRKLDIVREFRVHSFLGRAIRVGEKVVSVEGAHPWIRSLDGGWRLSYGAPSWYAFSGKQRVRDLAHTAVRALGLDFGAVDIGIQQSGEPVIFEVNRAPGLEGGTISKYVEAINAAASRE